MKGPWRPGEKGWWCPIAVRSDADLVAGKPRPWTPLDDPKARSCEQIFSGFRDALAPFAESPTDSPAVTPNDFSSHSSPPTPLGTEKNLFFAVQSRDEQWLGLQFQVETIVFRKGLLVALELFMWHPAKSGGGFDIGGSLSAGSDTTTFTFRVDYHPSEAGAFRLLRALLMLGDLFDIPVQLREGMDV